MAVSLDDLINSLPGSMSGEILTPEAKQAKIDAIVARAMPENLRKYGQTAQQQNEAAFGKGMGLSTWNAYQQALNSLAQTEGAGQIGNNAQQEVDAAQRAAIGNAASYATSERNRAAQQGTANQANATARRGQDITSRNQTQGQIFSGLGALGSGAVGVGARMLATKPGAEGSPGKVWENAKGNLGFGGTPAEEAPMLDGNPVGSAAGASEMASNPGAYNAPTMNLSDIGGGNGGFSPSYGGGYSPMTYGSPDLDLSSLFDNAYNNNYYLDNYGGAF